MSKPNILFFFADDMRFDTLSCVNNPQIITPNLDELVGRGTVFTQAHIPCGTSGAVCMPSRAMLHTGRFLFSLEGEGQSIPPEHITMGETLQKAGYNTFGTGKWHNGTESFARSFTDGGEIFFGGMWDHWNVPSNDYDPTGRYEKAAPFIRNPFFEKEIMNVTCDHLTPGAHSTDLFCETIRDYILGYDSDKPFFAYLAYMAPHDPRSMPQKYLDIYADVDINLPVNYKPEHDFDFGVSEIRDEVLEAYPRSEQAIKQHIKEYYGMITHLDDRLGDVIAGLKSKGMYDNTIIVFAGDNGLALGQHGLMGKQSNYEHSVRVPLIYAGPGIPKGESRDELVYILDVYPTLMELIKVEAPSSVEGISMVDTIKNGNAIRDKLYFAYTDSIRSIKINGYKLIEYRPEGLPKQTQLFNIENDPSELVDLSKREGFADKIELLRVELKKYRDGCGEMNHYMGRDYWGRF